MAHSSFVRRDLPSQSRMTNQLDPVIFDQWGSL